MNIDLSFEYYPPAGLLSIAPFYKHIDNPIYDRSDHRARTSSTTAARMRGSG